MSRATVKGGVCDVPQVVVVISEGLVSEVYFHGVERVDVIVLDTDTEGSADDEGVETVELAGEAFEAFIGGPLPTRLAQRFSHPDLD